MKSKPLPSQEYLRIRMTYDPGSGILAWIPKTIGTDASRWNARYAGKPAGRLHPKGHTIIMLDGQFYSAHRLIWRMVTGDDPGEMEVDHRDTDTGNDRWGNLRLADRSGQCANRKCYKAKVLQVKGVYPQRSGRFMAKIMKDRKLIHLGTFDTVEQAAAAYSEAAALYHGEFARAA